MNTQGNTPRFLGAAFLAVVVTSLDQRARHRHGHGFG